MPREKRTRDSEDKKEEDKEDEAQVESNKRVLEELVQQIPTYDWQTPPLRGPDRADYDEIKIPKPKETINYKKEETSTSKVEERLTRR